MNRLFLAPTSLGTPPPLEYIQAAARAGYDGVGLRLYRSPGQTYAFHPVVGNRALIRDMQKALGDAGLEVLDIFSFYVRADVDFDEVRAAIETSAELGARYVFAIGSDPDWSRLRESFAKMCAAAESVNLRVALETPVLQQALPTLPLALQLVQEVGRDNVSLSLDPEQFDRAGHKPDDLTSVDPGLFAYAQLNDHTDSGGRCGPGRGVVPLGALLDRLPADIDLSVEWSAPPPGPSSADAWAKETFDTARSFLEHYYASRSTSPQSSGHE